MAAQRLLDHAALARVQQRVLAWPDAPWLHGEVARRMAERLPLIRLQPQRVLDWCAQVGASRHLLQQAYPQAEVVAVEPTPGTREATARALQPAWW